MFTIVGVVRSMPLYPLWKQYRWCKDYHQLWYTGAVGNLSGLIEPTGFVDRDMDVRPLGFELDRHPLKKVLESDTKELSWVVEILSQPVHQRSSVT